MVGVFLANVPWNYGRHIEVKRVSVCKAFLYIALRQVGEIVLYRVEVRGANCEGVFNDLALTQMRSRYLFLLSLPGNVASLVVIFLMPVDADSVVLMDIVL